MEALVLVLVMPSRLSISVIMDNPELIFIFDLGAVPALVLTIYLPSTVIEYISWLNRSLAAFSLFVISYMLLISASKAHSRLLLL